MTLKIAHVALEWALDIMTNIGMGGLTISFGPLKTWTLGPAEPNWREENIPEGNFYSMLVEPSMDSEEKDDDCIDGIHIDDIKDSLKNLYWLLTRLDVIYAYDSGEGEPTVWMKK